MSETTEAKTIGQQILAGFIGAAFGAIVFPWLMKAFIAYVTWVDPLNRG